MKLAPLLLLASLVHADQLTPYGSRTFYSVDGEWRLVTKEQKGKMSFVLKNKADGLVYSTEKTLEEFAENIDEGDKNAIEKALESTWPEL